ncbi:unnamed protein product [Lactuca virosa]|uniref:Protein kinase domain-containing protein n=1 Tax=Lactuca virosa TaxID=75947 RepID=A0AAU9MSD8_9ASTR|nr:unnamed protein product [Lactuca virosa]
MLSKLKHNNVVSIVGFNDEFGKIIIYKHETIGSLDTFLRDPNLTWMRRLQICVGVAHGLGYIYYDKGRDFSVIHCDIRSSKILLDANWEAKLSGFELSMKQASRGRNDLCFTDVCGTLGYRDPVYDKSGSVTHKSDMYSFGIVLFEVLCGKKAVDEEDNRLLAPIAKSHYEGGGLDVMIDPGLHKQMDPRSFQIFSEVAYYCLKEERSQRPNINQVVMNLEKALEYQWKHVNRLILKASFEGTTSKNLKGKDIKHLEIPLTDIENATKNFAKTYVIGSGGYGEKRNPSVQPQKSSSRNLKKHYLFKREI